MSPRQYRHTQSNGLGTVACTYCAGSPSLSLGLRQSQTLAHHPRRQEAEEVGLCNDYNGFWDLTWLLSGGGSKDSQLFRQQCCKVIYTSK